MYTTRSASYFLTVAVLLICAAVAHVAACTCANGGARTSAARCECSCPAGWYPPTCDFTASQHVEVFMAFANTTAAPYVASGQKVYRLYTEYGLSDAPGPVRAAYTFRRLTADEPADRSVIHLIVKVRGDVVDRIVSTFDPASPGARRMALLQVRYVVREASAPGALADSPTVFTIDAGNFTVPLPAGAVAFPLAALGVLILVPLSERLFACCCEGGAEEHERLAEADADPFVAAFRRKQAAKRRQSELEATQQLEEGGGSGPPPHHHHHHHHHHHDDDHHAVTGKVHVADAAVEESVPAYADDE